MNECIDSLREATAFSTVNANCVYWPIELDERDGDKKSFTLHQRRYRFTEMQFGLKNTAGTYQRAMDVILVLVCWQFVFIYPDDIVVFSKSPRITLSQRGAYYDRYIRLESLSSRRSAEYSPTPPTIWVTLSGLTALNVESTHLTPWRNPNNALHRARPICSCVWLIWLHGLF